MRQDLVTYLDLESWGWDYDIFRRPAIEFVQPEDGYTTDGSGGTFVRVVEGSAPGLGVEHLSAGDLALIYTAGTALLDVDPADRDLAGALDVIAETMYGEPPHPDTARQLEQLPGSSAAGAGATPQGQDRLLPVLAPRCHRPRHRAPEVTQTHRGWEVDAGLIGPRGTCAPTSSPTSGPRTSWRIRSTRRPRSSPCWSGSGARPRCAWSSPRTPAGPPTCTPSVSPWSRRTSPDSLPTFNCSRPWMTGRTDHARQRSRVLVLSPGDLLAGARHDRRASSPSPVPTLTGTPGGWSTR